MSPVQKKLPSRQKLKDYDITATLAIAGLRLAVDKKLGKDEDLLGE
jgi:hypothetical protein